MVKVAVVIITYRRPAGLLRVLEALEVQEYAGSTEAPNLVAVVVDNEKEPAAASVVQGFSENNKLEVRYIHEPNQGIPLARNAGLAAVQDDFDYFCFIDDDEWPGTTWIYHLLETQRRNHADCVLGAVIPVFPEDAPKWIISSRVFDSWQFADNAQLKEAASNNVLISCEFVKSHQLKFDERMRMTGGSDYLFFKQAYAAGMKIFWSENAPVYEDVPKTRLTFRWITQRQYRLGNTFSVSEHLTGTYTGLAILAIKGALRIGLGLIMLPTFIGSYYLGMKGVSHILRGSGILAGVFGHSHQEYSSKSLLKDRLPKSTS